MGEELKGVAIITIPQPGEYAQVPLPTWVDMCERFRQLEVNDREMLDRLDKVEKRRDLWRDKVLALGQRNTALREAVVRLEKQLLVELPGFIDPQLDALLERNPREHR